VDERRYLSLGPCHLILGRVARARREAWGRSVITSSGVKQKKRELMHVLSEIVAQAERKRYGSSIKSSFSSKNDNDDMRYTYTAK